MTTICPKGFNSETLLEPNMSCVTKHTVAEFCKRVSYNGEELTTVSPMTLIESVEYPTLFPIFFNFRLSEKKHISHFEGLGLLAWLGYNPDQSVLITSFLLTTALPSNILEGLVLLKEQLSVPWVR
jgi:hypothetical protein